MTDNDLETIYKAAISESHFAGLRAVYDAGYVAGQGGNLANTTFDPSLTAAAPVSDPQAALIQTP